MEDNYMSYAKVVAIAKRIAAQSGGGTGGGVSKQEFNAHVANDSRHLTNEDREILVKVNQYRGYFSTSANIPTEGIEGDYILVGETQTFWVWDVASSQFVNTTQSTYDDTEIRTLISRVETEAEELQTKIVQLEGQVDDVPNDSMTYEELDDLLQ